MDWNWIETQMVSFSFQRPVCPEACIATRVSLPATTLSASLSVGDVMARRTAQTEAMKHYRYAVSVLILTHWRLIPSILRLGIG